MKKWIAVILAAVFAAACLSGQPLEAEAAKGMYKVATGSLPVHKEPGQKSDVKGSLFRGAVVQVSDEQYGWMKVTGEGVSGWAAGQYLVKVGTGSQSNADSIENKEKAAFVTGSGLRIRSGPGTQYSVVGKLGIGDRVTLLQSGSDWSRIKAGKQLTGWVSSQYIAEDESNSNIGSKGGSKKNGLSGRLIVLDPGHGGNDPGKIGTTYNTEEKKLTLTTSKLLADELQSRGAKVVLTRTKDSQKPSLQERVNIAESAKADAFVSIHYNSSPRQSSGSMVFYYSKTKDISLARTMESELEHLSLRSNGVAFGNYHVLRENNIPAVLLELAFLSNAKDEAEARTDKYQHQAAAVIADGLEVYFSNK